MGDGCQSLRPLVPQSLSPFSLSLLTLTLILAGCSPRVGGGEPVDKVIYELRRDRDALQAKVESLEEQLARRQAQITSLEKQLFGQTSPVDGVAPADVPRVVSLRFDRLSRLNDKDKDGRADEAVVYLETLDQHGRLLPATGRAELTITAPGEGDDERVTLGRATFDPPAFQDAYRSGLTGSHYTLRVPLDATPGQPAASLTEATASIRFTDAATGVTLEHEGKLPFHAATPSASDADTSTRTTSPASDTRPLGSTGSPGRRK